MTDSTSPALSFDQLVSIDQLATEFERAWREGCQPRIEDVLACAPSSIAPQLLHELLLLDFELKQTSGLSPSVSEYFQRFPEFARQVERAFHSLTTALASTHSQPASSGGSHRLDAASTLPHLRDYELDRVLGEGGMGVVYLAKKRDRPEEHQVAVKMLRSVATPESSLRFMSEMATMARLQHPHIVPVLDSGRDLSDAFYFVMPYYPAGDLGAVLQRTGYLTPQTAAEYALAIAWALAYLHERGIVHRDLKLRNILLDDYRDGRFPHGRPCLTDFGLVKLLEQAEVVIESDRITGTILNMSPEQAAGLNQSVGAQADVWAVGILLFELLTTRTPFSGRTIDDVRYKILRSEPPLVRTLRAAAPRDLELIVSKCLEKDPVRRYGTANALIEDLTSYLKNEPLVHAMPRRTSERIERWARRKPAFSMRLVVIGALLMNIWLNRLANKLGWIARPKPDALHWNPQLAEFMEFWFDQILLIGWCVLSWCFQRAADYGASPRRVRICWLATDSLILTVILWNVEALHSPLIAAYAALIVASGLWQDVALVILTTGLAMAGYFVLAASAALQLQAPPLYEILHVITTFVVLGVLMCYFLRRSRILERIYKHDPAL